MQFKRVLCPVDFSDFSVSAYEYALTVAEYYKAHLVAEKLWAIPKKYKHTLLL